MAQTPWEKLEDGKYRCTRCVDAAPFDPSVEDHECPAGGSVVVTESLGRAESAPVRADTDASGSPADDCTGADGYWLGVLLDVESWERRLHAIDEALRRLRGDALKVATEDEYETSDDGKRGIWRQSWQAHHSKIKLRLMVLAEERKVAVSALEAATRRLDPQKVADERLLAEFKRIKAGRVSKPLEGN